MNKLYLAITTALVFSAVSVGIGFLYMPHELRRGVMNGLMEYEIRSQYGDEEIKKLIIDRDERMNALMRHLGINCNTVVCVENDGE